MANKRFEPDRHESLRASSGRSSASLGGGYEAHPDLAVVDRLGSGAWQS